MKSKNLLKYQRKANWKNYLPWVIGTIVIGLLSLLGLFTTIYWALNTKNTYILLSGAIIGLVLCSLCYRFFKHTWIVIEQSMFTTRLSVTKEYLLKRADSIRIKEKERREILLTLIEVNSLLKSTKKGQVE